MSTQRIIATFRDLTNFNELFMNNIPNKEDTQTRKEKLLGIRNCLIKENVTQVEYEEQVRCLTELLNTFVELNRQNEKLQKEFLNYGQKYDKFIIQIKHVILTVRMQIILLDLS